VELLGSNRLILCRLSLEFGAFGGGLTLCLEFFQLLFRFFGNVLVLDESGLHIAIGWRKRVSLV
jgi:hypothetical protein